ncbi:MAG TPA: amidohydrolase family protein, partial [Gemmatimonadales bacterium]|nr:amidohydrolase family protein [Gemmatimonadales bacterium]
MNPSLRHTAGATAWALIACLACAGPGGERRGAGPSVAVIDAHIHTRFTGEPEPVSGIPVSRDELLRQMAAAGVVGAVAHTDTAGGGYADLSASGVVHCRGVRIPVDLPGITEGLRSGRFRCLKIYLGYTYHYAYDPGYAPVYRLAAQFDVPVVFHTGDTYSARGKLKYADPLTVDEVAVEHPDVRFVIAHAGYPWIQSAAEVAYKNPNVFLEASAFMLGSADTADPAWVH